jgi:pre-mRNA-processing factor 6
VFCDSISDLKKARLLLKSVITNNAKSASGWIAAARVEELDGKLEEARNIIAQGCNNCLDSDDIWIEAARLSVIFKILFNYFLQAPDKSRAILAKGIAQIPSSVKLWRAAAKKEKDIKAKSKVLKKALEYIPHSALLWKEAIELESEEEAKMLLYKAVECIPLCVDMWLALAKLETYENSRIVLNKARLAIPTDHTIWIHAAKLEEAQGNSPSVENIIRRAIKTLTKHGVTLGREQWLGHAENAELGGSIQTANAIIKYTFHLNLPKEDLKKTVIQNAKGFILNGAIKCGRAIYQETLDVFPTKKSLWMEAIQLEREHGSTNSLTKILASAVEKCSFAQIFHLMYAKHLWLQVTHFTF